MTRALVIGGNGFLGSSLVEALRSRVGAVRVLDRFPPRQDVDWTGVEYRLGEFDDGVFLREALSGVSVVFHLASSTVPSTSNADPVHDVSSNLVGALKLVDAMQHAGVRRIVFFSSGGTVYGDTLAVPVDEDHPLNPISSYGVVKVAVESYLRMYERMGILDPLIIRPSNPYGPRQSVAGIQGAIASFLGKALDGASVSIWGDGGIIRDYIYIDDLISLVVDAGLSDYNGALNAGSGRGHTLNEVCDVIRKVTGRQLPVSYLPGRAFDVKRIVLGMDKARMRFGWAPKVQLADGIARTWNALESKNG